MLGRLLVHTRMGSGVHLILWMDSAFAVVKNVIWITILNILLDHPYLVLYQTAFKNAMEVLVALSYMSLNCCSLSISLTLSDLHIKLF